MIEAATTAAIFSLEAQNIVKQHRTWMSLTSIIEMWNAPGRSRGKSYTINSRLNPRWFESSSCRMFLKRQPSAVFWHTAVFQYIAVLAHVERFMKLDSYEPGRNLLRELEAFFHAVCNELRRGDRGDRARRPDRPRTDVPQAVQVPDERRGVDLAASNATRAGDLLYVDS
jgi:hypothetical protein